MNDTQSQTSVPEDIRTELQSVAEKAVADFVTSVLANTDLSGRSGSLEEWTRQTKNTLNESIEQVYVNLGLRPGSKYSKVTCHSNSNTAGDWPPSRVGWIFEHGVSLASLTKIPIPSLVGPILHSLTVAGSTGSCDH